MSGEASRKRARLETKDGEKGDTEDAEFWFDDGNIILEARGVRFKVYQGPLVAHSPFFRVMLSLPQPSPGEATSESSDAPHVVALADSPEDLRHFLRALMPTHKYQVDRVVEEGLQYFRTLYPDDYATLQERHDQELPNAICAIGVVNILDGFVHKDGTCESLSSADLRRCLQAKEKLITARVQAAYRIFNGRPSIYCMNKEDDTEYLRSLHADLPHEHVDRMCSASVFRRWWPELKDYIPGLCSECDQMIRDAETDGQGFIFADLPLLVGVKVDEWERRNRKFRQQGRNAYDYL
ncbi:hypothetical protein L226DRAFT_572897 [Lentinus tigrinus ALCF2SS1-7]|uniref:BTB domain-containing protein n=1 Tax=Lentinus tigrinus ALCF2SS1-6 TaxID=1328759 RepID=A0A5C2S4P6_9APHY|nr:hypothetical protein L227DRAFT_612682 [Lentinus tigrinus ALCF2SS1-6]RPD72791.1 hypothetical protein L226DRAFT_572897 [Lentinus tigrinus ALCF2SS1-7]